MKIYWTNLAPNLPLLTSCCEAFVVAGENVLDTIKKIHNQSLRIVAEAIKTTPIDAMLMLTGDKTLRTVIQEKALILWGHKGYCYCKPEYFGDGFTCTKIPWSYHRDKRIKRRVSRRHREPKTTANVLSQIFSELSTDVQPVIEEDTAHLPYFIETSGAMLMEYEEEDSYLVSMCKEKRDCNQHASCYARKTGHPFCRCNSGYRGNGIFCWEMIDYIAAKDQRTDKAPD
ncbi:EGF-like domain-containing protein [Trichonephila clavata]|uniref:EGF-like domain-containing protein n=1 Tax=Trichonephila clavata TaxID=2740835 RepID=A0A8X6HXC5_TRICU|nr:EGF-like domain-containing protein [Trichonephila clavata]